MTLEFLRGFEFFAGVPDSQLKAVCAWLLDRYGLDPAHHVIAANEGNAAALAAGYHLATGKTPVVYLQNSGLGNIVNPAASLLNGKVYGIPCLFIVPIISPAFVIAGIGIYFSESGKAEKKITARREEIEYELPRFVATLTQELQASRDVLSMLETYQKNAGAALKNELAITVADMRTGNFEGALTRFEARVSSAMLSDVVRGLIGVLRGDDGVAFFRMLSHDMKQLELQRLKKLAMERPPKIRRYSFLLLGCMLLLYIGVMGYQILGTMSGMF